MGALPPVSRATDLPDPPAEAAAHSARVAAHVASEIAASGGAIGFDRYMELALYAPGLGYYAAGAAEVLEVGAGSGALAASLLGEMQASGATPSRYRILEPSPDLRSRQRERLLRAGDLGGVDLSWQADLPEHGFRGVVIANEVLDAIPVRRFRVGEEGGIEEQQAVLTDGGRLALRFAAPTDDGLAAAVERIQQELGYRLPAGYVSEVSPAREAWLATLAGRLTGGVLLLVDYGYSASEYYHPQRRDGTLACHYRHRRHEAPLAWPGLCDITAHVDFSRQAAAADAAGLDVAGFTTQAHFLLGNGLLDLVATMEPGRPDFVRAAGLVQRLTMPQEMGEAVRVMALARGVADGALPGFESADLRSRL